MNAKFTFSRQVWCFVKLNTMKCGEILFRHVEEEKPFEVFLFIWRVFFYTIWLNPLKASHITKHKMPPFLTNMKRCPQRPQGYTDRGKEQKVNRDWIVHEGGFGAPKGCEENRDAPLEMLMWYLRVDLICRKWTGNCRDAFELFWTFNNDHELSQKGKKKYI